MKLTKEEKRTIGSLRDESDLASANISAKITKSLKNIVIERISYLDMSMSRYIKELILEDLDDSGIDVYGQNDQEFMQ